MAKSGQLREKVGEKQLIELLETISAQTTSGPTIKVIYLSVIKFIIINPKSLIVENLKVTTIKMNGTYSVFLVDVK